MARPGTLRQAVAYGVGVIAVAGIVFAVYAVVDKGSVMLASTVPAILFLGGVGAFVKTYRVWRDGGTWPIWQGAGWFLLTLMLVCLSIPVVSRDVSARLVNHSRALLDFHFAEFALEDLAGRVARQLVEEDHLARHLVAGQVLPDVGLDGVLVDAGPLGLDHEARSRWPHSLSSTPSAVASTTSG